MIREYSENTSSGRFTLHSSNELFSGKGIKNPTHRPINTFAYNKGGMQKVIIDEVAYNMPGNSILPLVSNQHFIFEHPENITAWQFNREFYCIVDHDAEVGCVGFLFYGIQHPMFIKINNEEANEIIQMEESFLNELLVKDNFQGEMLRSLLKRLIIMTTRIAKRQNESYQQFPDQKMDLIRKFSLLLEENFKSEHEVKYYARLLNRAPKTLSNAFSLLRQPAPSILIRNRILLEARRYLYYTNKTAKEIAYELGFESPAHFSRFFKLKSGEKISDFRSSR